MPVSSSPVVSREQWLAARRELLELEKDLDRRRDALSARRRTLPRVRVTADYTFASERGRVSLADLFGDRSQLIVYHFMFAPGWGEGCPSCSFVSDHFDGALPHLRARDVAFAAVSRAPLEEILPFKARMGWRFEWVSSFGTSFNFDHGVSFTDEALARGYVDYNYASRPVGHEEMPGLSVFARDADGVVHHTYSTYARGLDRIINTYNLLDLVPSGRSEGREFPMEWVRYRDSYGMATIAS